MSDKYVTYSGSLYDYSSGAYCGVLMKENVMKKLVKLQTKHLESVKRLLTDEADRGNVFPSFWTLHYPDGKQTIVTFIEEGQDVYSKIKTATCSYPPVHKPLVFEAKTMEEAAAMADARHEELEE